MSSARAFYPALGSRIDPRRPRGYYIDFRLKDQPLRLGEAEQELHVAIVQWGLGAYERYLDGDGEESFATAVRAADHLIERQIAGGIQDGGLPHLWPLTHTFRVDPPWLSAIAQGEAASLFARIHAETGEDRFAEAALRALRPMNAYTEEGGLRVRLGSGFFCEEYPTEPPSMVLNGGIFALWGYLDVALSLSDADARREFEVGLDTLAENIRRWDTGGWTRYDLFPHPVINVASPFYHVLHINQLRAMQLVAPRPELAAAAERFEGYQASRGRRMGAFARKVLFRLMVPRSRFLGRRPLIRPRRGTHA